MRKTPSNPSRLAAVGPGGQPAVARPSAARAVGPADDPVAAAAATVRAAETLVVKTIGDLEVAQARLREANDAAPRVSPRVAAAQADRHACAGAASGAAHAAGEARRAAADRASDLEAAEALLDDLTSGTKKHTPGQLVAAQARVDKADRAARAATEAVRAAQDKAASQDAQLAAAEQHLDEVRREPAADPAAVVAARVKVRTGQRAVQAAQEDLAARQASYDALAQAVANGKPAGPPVVPVFASVDAFVEEYVLPNWRHKMSDRTCWCRQWWRHDEAVTRLEALWEAFEAMRRQPAPSLSTWLRDHLDHHMAALTAEAGTFARCAATDTEQVHEQCVIWDHEHAPAGMFPADPDASVQPDRDRTEGVSA